MMEYEQAFPLRNCCVSRGVDNNLLCCSVVVDLNYASNKAQGAQGRRESIINSSEQLIYSLAVDHHHLGIK